MKVRFNNVSFSYDEESVVLKNFNLSINNGEMVAILGHNGSGKSTIAKIMMGLLEVSSGEIYINDKLLNSDTVEECRNHMSIIFQNPDNQFIGATVRDDIAFGLENHCIPREEMDDLINGYADKVHMTKYLDSEPTRLSGGQKQRVAIAGVLAMSPEILILDEATSMLDPQGREEINALVHEIHSQNKMSIVSITHDIEEVAKSDRVIVMHQGKVYMEGKPQDILTREKELISMNLDVPFAYSLSKALQKKGIQVSENITLESLVKELCQ